MKKKSILKILSGAVCLSMMMSITAFAASDVVYLPLLTESQSAKTADSDVVYLPQLTADVNDKGTGAADERQESEYVVRSGIITEVQDMGEYHRIQVGDFDNGIIFNVRPEVFAVDQKTGKKTAIKDLAKDMSITAVIPANVPMALSLPPQTSGAVAFIINSEGASVDVSLYDEELINKENSLKLNLSDDTVIVDTEGTEKIYSAEDVKGKNCVVLYTVTTRSIPAQTNPEMVIILGDSSNDELAQPEAAGTESTEAAPTEAVKSEYKALREAAEAKGYEIQWTSNKKPIIMTKNDMTIEITIGSNEFTFTHMTKDLKALDRMEKMDMPVVLENGRTMVSSSFIDALE